MNIEITPAMIEAAKHLQTADGDYWPASYKSLGLPEGVQMYNYFDKGVWLVNDNDSCNMEDATKLVCVLLAPIVNVRAEFVRLAVLNVPKNKHRYDLLLDIDKLSEMLSVAELQAKIEKMRASYIGTKLEKYLSGNNV